MNSNNHITEKKIKPLVSLLRDAENTVNHHLIINKLTQL